MKYTENLNLPTKIKNFNLTQSNFKSIYETKKKNSYIYKFRFSSRSK